MTSFGTQRRDDHVPGYCYLIEAEDTNGWIPGKLVRRCKIGLSRNPELRRQNFVNAQFPCNVTIITTIYVEDMADTEAELHKIFKHCNIKLEKSREWFQLNPIDYYRCLFEFWRREAIVFSIEDIPIRKILIGLCSAIAITTLGVGAYQLESFQAPQTNQVK